MTENTKIADGLKKVFLHRSSFIVIGLTGRTGSGCSTIADILCKSNFDTFPKPSINSPPRTNEDRRNKIITEWAKHNWSSFTKIQVSNIILLLSISVGREKFVEYLEKIDENINKQKISSIISDEIVSISKKSLVTLNDIKNSSDIDVNESFSYIFDKLELVAKDIKKYLNLNDKKLFTKVFQALGDNVRKSGDPLTEDIDPSKLFTLPDLISRIIKLARFRNKISNKSPSNYFVIDAIRHPFEIRYLRERIVPFYSIAITTSDEHRKHRLFQKDMNQTEINRLDEKEYPSIGKPKSQKKQNDYDSFVSQNIQACLEISDIYICNFGRKERQESDPDITQAAFTMLKYISLMQHPGLILPSNTERCMQVAFTAKLNSGCISRQVGAVICDENFSIKAIGWNDVPEGKVPCLFRNVSHLTQNQTADDKAYSKYEKDKEFKSELKKTYTGKDKTGFIDGHNISFCFKSIYNAIRNDKNQVHTRSLHAEENAFLQIVKYGGVGIKGGYLFTTASPCELCSKKAFQLGITKIFYIDPYPGISMEHVLSEGEFSPQIELFSGTIGKAYHMLYEPIMPYKDELNKIFISTEDLQGKLF